MTAFRDFEAALICWSNSESWEQDLQQSKLYKLCGMSIGPPERVLSEFDSCMIYSTYSPHRKPHISDT